MWTVIQELEENLMSKDCSFCKIIFLGTLAKSMICKLETPFTSWNDCIKFHSQQQQHQQQQRQQVYFKLNIAYKACACN